MTRRPQAGSALSLLATLLHACEYDDARHAQRPRLVVRHPASSGSEAPSAPAPSAPPSPEQLRLEQLRAQTRPHVAVAVGAEWFVGSALLVPLPAISLDVGAQIRDVFAVYAMTRVASLVAVNRFALGPAFEWAPLDVLSIGAGATAVVTHSFVRGGSYWRFLVGFPVVLNVDIPTTSRPNIARDSFRISIELTPMIDPDYLPRPLLNLGVGLGYARR